MIEQLNFLGLIVKDLGASTQFYTDTLGLSVNEQESIPDFYTQFSLDGGMILGLITGFEQEGIQQAFDTALRVTDVDALYAQYQEKGVELLNEPRDMPFGRTFLFRTPDGHVLRAFAKPSQN
jgi:predicted enzyme related to lactoylglutathione lyase